MQCLSQDLNLPPFSGMGSGSLILIKSLSLPERSFNLLPIGKIVTIARVASISPWSVWGYPHIRPRADERSGPSGVESGDQPSFKLSKRYPQTAARPLSAPGINQDVEQKKSPVKHKLNGGKPRASADSLRTVPLVWTDSRALGSRCFHVSQQRSTRV